MRRLLKFLILFSLIFSGLSFGFIASYVAIVPELPQKSAAPKGPIVNDVTGMNPILVAEEATPKSIEEVQTLVRDHSGPISVGGGHFSMGGQTAAEETLHLDMRQLNSIVSIDDENKRVIVQSGATWRKIQEAIDVHNLSLSIMQSYSNFTVGGSLSVNVHGRYIGAGPIVSSVESIRVVLASGELVEASRVTNPEIFYGCIGGYGGLGVIVEATLRLEENTKVKRELTRIPVGKYRQHFADQIRDDRSIIFQNGDLLPMGFDEVYSVVWRKTLEAPTNPRRLSDPNAKPPFLDRMIKTLVFDTPFGIYLRRFLEARRYNDAAVVWRNFEASYDISDLAPITGPKWSYVLQEYFVPVERFDEFATYLKAVLLEHNVHIANVSIRHALPDTDTMLAWANKEVFAFVLYYWQYNDPNSRREVGAWTRKLIEASVAFGGSYYLPYQIHASHEQFERAYPRAKDYFALKQRLDPGYKFRNKLFDAYYEPTEERKLQEATFDATNYGRAEDQTYLTLPEWYLVFASEDLAKIAARSPEHDFPFFHAIGQFWTLYARVYKTTDKHYPQNWGYHFMNLVIGFHTSVEYLLKGLYENTVGRLSAAVGKISGPPHDFTVDAYISQVYADYAKFIHHTPWYAYPFLPSLKKLWSISLPPGESQFRHYERKLSFSLELFVKGCLGKLFSIGSGQVYGAEDERIQAIVRVPPGTLAQTIPEAQSIKQVTGDTELVSLPRYQAFTDLVTRLVTSPTELPFSFLEIAGNRAIALTLITPTDWVSPLEDGSIIDELRLLSEPGKKRVALSVDVRNLLTDLRAVLASGASIDHIYDY